MIFLLVFPVMLILGLIAVAHLNKAPTPHDSKVLRAWLIAYLILLIGGFGLCGAWGTGMGIKLYFSASQWESGYAILVLVPGVIGLLIAVGFFVVARKAMRKTPAQNPKYADSEATE